MTGKEKKQKEKARQAKKLQEQAAYLQENKAWNWVWPQDVDGKCDETLPRNCWFTGLKPRNPNSTHNGIELMGTQPYFGPSKNAIKKRKARRGLRTTEASMLAATRVVGSVV